MMGVSIHTIILENIDSWFVASEEESYVEDIWDAFPSLRARTQLNRFTVLLEWSPAPSWTSGKAGKVSSTIWAVLPCFRKGQVGTSSDVKALKLKSGSILYRRNLLVQNCQRPQLKNNDACLSPAYAEKWLI